MIGKMITNAEMGSRLEQICKWQFEAKSSRESGTLSYNAISIFTLSINFIIHPLYKIFDAKQVRNESAENFLSLLKEWERLCASYSLFESNIAPHPFVNLTTEEDEDEDEEEDDNSEGDGDSEVFEVEEVLDICYGDPKESDSIGLYLKVLLICN